MNALLIWLIRPGSHPELDAELEDVLGQESLTVTSIHRGQDGHHSWLKLVVRGPLPRGEALVRLRDAAAAMNCDLVAADPSGLPRRAGLAVFDMDSTLIQCEVIDELARRHGVYDQVSAITAAAMRGELDFVASFTRRMALLKGLDGAVIAAIRDSLPIMPGLPEMMQGLRRAGWKTAILSGGFHPFADELQRRYGFDFVVANTLEIVDGRLTGIVHPPVVDGEVKRQSLLRLRQELGLEARETVAVGDGANDIPMILEAGLGCAFHAKPLTRAKAPHSLSFSRLDGLLPLLGQG
ncbi:MAG: phosphoserine phosphatase [Verrucomicrobiota bacterium]|jgi:phosphoserine phosphatase